MMLRFDDSWNQNERPLNKHRRLKNRIGWHRVRGALAVALWAALLIGTGGTAFCQSKDPKIAAISSLLQRSDNTGALSLADQALARAPSSCPLMSLRAIALARLNQVDKALASFTNAISICPRYLPALEGAAQIEYSRADPGTPGLLKRILAVDDGNITAHAMLASFYRSRNDCKAALPEFEASRPLFATRPELSEGFGSCLAQSGAYKEALQIYLVILRANPTQTIQYDVALLQWRTKLSDDALTTLEPLVSANYAPALALASRIYEERGDTPQSVTLLRSAILLDPDNIDYYLEFANIAFAHKSFQVGIDMLNDGLTQLPNSALLLIARGVLEAQLGKNELAVADFVRAHQLNPNISYADDALGMIRTQEHEGARSLAFFQSAARLHPDDAFLQYLLAEQLSQAASDQNGTDSRAAIDAATNAIRLDPTYTPAHDLLARLYVQKNQFTLAIKEAEAALAQDPNDESALYQEIMATRHMGDNQETKALVARLQAAREVNAKHKQMTDRYRLLDQNTQ
jgi:tetratricopeptide (TPR) repeat protein